MDPVERGKELKRLRELAGLRQRDVAAWFGELTDSAVSSWETGKSAPEIHRLKVLDDKYGAGGKVLRMYGVPVPRRDEVEIRRLRDVTEGHGRALHALVSEVLGLPGVDPKRRARLERIRDAL